MSRHPLTLLHITISVLLILCLLPAAASAAVDSQSMELSVTICEVSVEADAVIEELGITIDGKPVKSVLTAKGGTALIAVPSLPPSAEIGREILVEVQGTAKYELGQKTVTITDIASDITVKLIGGKRVSVTFKETGNAGEEKKQELLEGIPQTLHPNEFTAPAACLKFAGWTDTLGGQLKYTNCQKITITEDLTLYALWNTVHTIQTIPAVDATCTKDGHTAGSKCSICGTTIIQPVTIKAAGHKPADPKRQNEIQPTENTEGSYDEIITCAICGEELKRTHITIPKLTPDNLWKITYHTGTADAGTPPEDTAQYKHNTEATIKDQGTLTKTGHTFKNWKDNKETEYEPGTAIKITENINLHPQWTPITYTITFNPQGGTNQPADITASYDEKTTLPSAAEMTKDGHKFGGWATAPGTGAKYGAGAAVKNLAAAEGEIVTLYAVWNKVEQLKIVESAETAQDTTTITKTNDETITADTNKNTAEISKDTSGEKINIFIEYQNEPELTTDSVTGTIDKFDLRYAKKIDLTPADTQKENQNTKAEISYEISRLSKNDLNLLKDSPKLTAGADTTEIDLLTSAHKIGGVLDGTVGNDLNTKLKQVGITVRFTLSREWVETRYGTNPDTIKQKIKAVHIGRDGTVTSFDYSLKRTSGIWGGDYLIEFVSYEGFSGYGILGDPITYTVTYQLNGGTWDAPNQITVPENTAIETWRIPVKEGDTFIDWYTDPALTQVYDKTAPVTKSFTLYAKWKGKPEQTANSGASHSSRNYGSSVWLPATAEPTPAQQPATDVTPVPTAPETPGQSGITEPLPQESDSGYTHFIIAAAVLAGLITITVSAVLISRRKRNKRNTTISSEKKSP